MHWSFDHDLGGEPPHFRAALQDAVAGWPAAGHVGTVVRRYDVLANYPAGRSAAALEPGGTLRIGVAAIDRSEAADGSVQYRVSHGNATSGEQVTLQFHTTGDPLPRLAGEWSVTAANSAGDRYGSVRCGGAATVSDGCRVISLTVDGLRMRTGDLDAALPLTCWWALFDGLPEIVRGAARADSFALLEDLEKLRAPCTVRPLAGSPVEVAGHRLRGYCQHGAGMLPSYWWLDDHGVVRIVSSVYHTLVLRAAGDGEDAWYENAGRRSPPPAPSSWSSTSRSDGADSAGLRAPDRDESDQPGAEPW